jgi:hypothetical protein
MQTTDTLPKPLVLTIFDYTPQLDTLEKAGKLPAELVQMLKSLLMAHVMKGTPPEANPREVQLAKEYLQGGIELTSSATTTLYDVVVWTPNVEHRNSLRPRFRLINKFANGQMIYLHDL